MRRSTVVYVPKSSSRNYSFMMTNYTVLFTKKLFRWNSRKLGFLKHMAKNTTVVSSPRLGLYKFAFVFQFLPRYARPKYKTLTLPNWDSLSEYTISRPLLAYCFYMSQRTCVLTKNFEMTVVHSLCVRVLPVQFLYALCFHPSQKEIIDFARIHHIFIAVVVTYFILDEYTPPAPYFYNDVDVQQLCFPYRLYISFMCNLV